MRIRIHSLKKSKFITVPKDIVNLLEEYGLYKDREIYWEIRVLKNYKTNKYHLYLFECLKNESSPFIFHDKNKSPIEDKSIINWYLNYYPSMENII